MRDMPYPWWIFGHDITEHGEDNLEKEREKEGERW